MEVLIGMFGGVAMFCFVSVYGLAFVDGGRMFLKRERIKSTPPARDQVASGPAFAPLDLGEPQMAWPSQVKHGRRPLPELKWPSETWTGDFFGRKGDGSSTSPLSPPKAAPHSATEDAWFDGGAPVAPPAAPAQKKQKPAKAEKAEKKQQPAQKAAPAKPPPAKPAPAKPPPSGGSGLDEDAIIAIVEREGLAAAVEKVRGATGADFQTAASQIAGILRKRRGRG